MGFSLRWLAILLGAVSIFSLSQGFYDFATAPVVCDLLPYYRSTIHPFAAVISHSLARNSQTVSLASPLLSPDLVIVYTALGFILLVLYLSDDLEWKRSGEHITLASLLGRITIACFWPLILPIALLFAFDPTPSALGNWVGSIGKMLMSAAFLFAANSCFSTLL
jgi:hypothetical protein